MTSNDNYIAEGTYIPTGRPTVRFPDVEADKTDHRNNSSFFVPWQNPSADVFNQAPTDESTQKDSLS